MDRKCWAQETLCNFYILYFTDIPKLFETLLMDFFFFFFGRRARECALSSTDAGFFKLHCKFHGSLRKCSWINDAVIGQKSEWLGCLKWKAQPKVDVAAFAHHLCTVWQLLSTFSVIMYYEVNVENNFSSATYWLKRHNTGSNPPNNWTRNRWLHRRQKTPKNVDYQQTKIQEVTNRKVNSKFITMTLGVSHKTQTRGLKPWL